MPVKSLLSTSKYTLVDIGRPQFLAGCWQKASVVLLLGPLRKAAHKTWQFVFPRASDGREREREEIKSVPKVEVAVQVTMNILSFIR